MNKVSEKIRFYYQDTYLGQQDLPEFSKARDRHELARKLSIERYDMYEVVDEHNFIRATVRAKQEPFREFNVWI